VSVDCRFTKDCERYLTDDCAACRHNRRRNAPKSKFERANDHALDESCKHGEAYYAVRVRDSYVTYFCPACEEEVYLCAHKYAGGKPVIMSCESCGLNVIVGF
jgi:hypothetical protein